MRERPAAKPVTLRLIPTLVPPAVSSPHEPVPQSTRDQRAPRTERPVPAPAQRPAVQDTVAPTSQAERAPVPAPAAAITTEDSITRFRRDAGNIDRDLRSKAPKLLEAPANTVQARLERGLHGAVRPGSTVMAETVLPDGRRVTKVASPGGGSYCVTQESAGASHGVDPFTQGSVNKVTNCGNLFD